MIGKFVDWGNKLIKTRRTECCHRNQGTDSKASRRGMANNAKYHREIKYQVKCWKIPYWVCNRKADCNDSFIRGVRVGESMIKLIVGWLMTGEEGKTMSMDYYLGEDGYEAERLVTTSGPRVDTKLSLFFFFPWVLFFVLIFLWEIPAKEKGLVEKERLNWLDREWLTEQLCHGGGMKDHGTEVLALSWRCTPTSATGGEKFVLI